MIAASNLKVMISPALGDLDVLGMNFLSKLASWRVEDGTRQRGVSGPLLSASGVSALPGRPVRPYFLPTSSGSSAGGSSSTSANSSKAP